MSFSSGDQAALVEVLQDYFSSPDGLKRDDWDDDESEPEETRDLLQGTILLY